MEVKSFLSNLARNVKEEVTLGCSFVNFACMDAQLFDVVDNFRIFYGQLFCHDKSFELWTVIKRKQSNYVCYAQDVFNGV